MTKIIRNFNVLNCYLKFQSHLKKKITHTFFTTQTCKASTVNIDTACFLPFLKKLCWLGHSLDSWLASLQSLPSRQYDVCTEIIHPLSSLARSLMKGHWGWVAQTAHVRPPHTSLTGRLASSKSTGSPSSPWGPFLLWGLSRACSVTLEAGSLGETVWTLKFPGLTLARDW